MSLSKEEIEILKPLCDHKNRMLEEYLRIDKMIFNEGNGFQVNHLKEYAEKKKVWQEAENLFIGLLLHYWRNR